jgi:nucleoside-diphosphate-sugar epimerase
MNKRALVTGGCGFIGSNLSRTLLNNGWRVDIVDDMSNGHLELLEGCNMRVVPLDLLEQFDKSDYVRGDDTLLVLQGDFTHNGVTTRIENKQYDVVFHQAAIPRVLYSVENPAKTTEVNILRTTRLFEACRGNVNRVVWASSSSIYGGSEVFPTKETCEKGPKSPYAWQKSAIEDVAKIFGALYDLDIVCLRYFNVYGPGQYGDSPYSTAVSAWCHAIKHCQPLRSDGDGSQSRDLCYIDNAVHANILAAESNKKFLGECYNVSCGDRTTNAEILEYLTDKFKHAIVVNAPWRAGDVMHTQADISKIKKDLGYEPLVRFWDGLERTIAWWGLEDDNL